MAENLNDIIARSSPGTVVVLPSGEFEGPVLINKPLRLLGKNTTIWAKKSPVIDICSPDVVIEDLRAELTEGSVIDDAIIARYPAKAKNIEVLGGVSGFEAEDGFFDVPRTIELGEFLADAENTFLLTVNVPEKTEVLCGMREVRISPTRLDAGRNEITVTVSGISSQTFLYAEIFFKTKFVRRIYLSGKPKSTAEAAYLKRIYTAPERDQLPKRRNAVPTDLPEGRPTDVISMTARQNPALPALNMARGQRVSLSQYIGSGFKIYFTCEKPREMEIDPYVFLLDKDERSLGDAGLIFFGNERSENGEAVYFPADGHVEIDLSKAGFQVQKIALAYSVYAGSVQNSFASVKNPRVSIRTDSERISFEMNGLSAEATVVAMEFYLYKGEWKISAVGAGFKDGMAKLCNRYGIEVIG